MKNENDKIDRLFENLNGQWDIYGPKEGHSSRFLKKQAVRKPRKNYWPALSIAAVVFILIGLFTFPHTERPQNAGLELASVQTREADSVFTSVIKTELQKIRQKNSPENEKIISDALYQMKNMDADYEKIKHELAKNGESEQIIHAMILNLQTRISFLEHVKLQIENNNQLKIKNDENTI